MSAGKVGRGVLITLHFCCCCCCFQKKNQKQMMRAKKMEKKAGQVSHRFCSTPREEACLLSGMAVFRGRKDNNTSIFSLPLSFFFEHHKPATCAALLQRGERQVSGKQRVRLEMHTGGPRGGRKEKKKKRKKKTSSVSMGWRLVTILFLSLCNFDNSLLVPLESSATRLTNQQFCSIFFSLLFSRGKSGQVMCK